MKKNQKAIVHLLLVPILGIILGACSTVSPKSTVDIVTTLAPVADLISTLAGPSVTVSSIVPPGVSPHDFEPTPRDLAVVQDASIVFTIGNGFDDWINPFLEGKKNVVLSEGIADIIDEHDSSFVNPHIWLSPKRVILMIPLIADALKNQQALSLSDSDIDQRSTAVTNTFRVIDTEYATTVAAFSSKDMIAVHEAWVYLAQDYGLTIASTIEPVEGQEPSAQDILALQSIIQEKHIRAIFSESQVSQDTIKTIARDLGVEVIELSPEGRTDLSSLEALLRFNLAQLRKGLGS